MKVRVQRALVGMMAVVLAATGVARAQQVLEQVPDDAMMVIKIRDIGGTSVKIGKIMTDLGIAAMKPGLENPLTFMQKQSGITQGVRSDGDLAIVYRDPEKTTEDPDKSMLVLVPVSDFNAFVANFGGAKAEGDITEVKLPEGHGNGFVSHWGNFAAVS